MNKTWIDIRESDWYFNSVMEATNLEMPDGSDFVSGIAFNSFKSGASPVFYEVKVSWSGYDYQVNAQLNPTLTNPVYVFLNGVQTVYKEIKPDPLDSTKSIISFYTPPKVGSKLTIVSDGVPAVDANGKPWVNDPSTLSYPYYQLNYGSTSGGDYVFKPFDRGKQENVNYLGRNLERVSITDQEWAKVEGATPTMTAQELLKGYIGLKQVVYTISPSGKVYTSYDLNNRTLHISYWYYDYAKDAEIKNSGEFKPTSTNVLYNDRFFPKAYVSRAEAIAWIARMKKYLWGRMTDNTDPNHTWYEDSVAYSGQRVVKLQQNQIPKDSEGNFINPTVKVDGVIKSFTVFDNTTILLDVPVSEGQLITVELITTISRRFTDVPDGAWYEEDVLDLEGDQLNDGRFLLTGVGGGLLKPLDNLTRAESVTFLNRLRRFMLERMRGGK